MAHNCNYRFGTLANGNSFVVGATDLYLPATITLTSAAGGRAIELTSDGTNWYTPTYDTTTANMINVSVKSPIKAYRVTGQAADTWNTR